MTTRKATLTALAAVLGFALAANAQQTRPLVKNPLPIAQVKHPSWERGGARGGRVHSV